MTPVTPSGTGRRLIRWVGTLLAIAAIVLLLQQFREHAGQISVDQWKDSVGFVLLAALGYALCGVPLGLVWWLSVRSAGVADLTMRQVVPVQWSSQLGKYLPGNVAHFAARHWMMSRLGVGHRSLVAAGLLEAMALMIAAGLVGVGVLRPALAIAFDIELPAGLELLALAFVFLATIAAWRWARRSGWVNAGKAGREALMEWLCAVLLAILFFIGMAICFLVVSGRLIFPDLPKLAPWIAAAWLLGFLVPGAPGGIGIREYVLVFGLTPMIGEPSSLVAAVLFRLVTVGGDAAMALAGLVMQRWNIANER